MKPSKQVKLLQPAARVKVAADTGNTVGCYKRHQGFFKCYFIRNLYFLLQKKQLATKIQCLLQAAATFLVAAATSNLVEVSAYPRGYFMLSFIKILRTLFEI